MSDTIVTARPQPGDDAAATNAVLERALAETRRTGEVVLASAVVAINGGLHVLATVQLWMFVWLRGPYRLVPPGILLFGLAFIGLGSRIYGQRLWAARIALVLSAASAISMGVWFLLAAGSGMISPLAMLLPAASITAAVCAALAVGPCRRAGAARRQAAAAGLDIDLG